MNNQKLKDHYVYFLHDAEGTVRYVGMGRQLRYKRTQERSDEFLEVLNNGGYFSFPHENLDKMEAQKFEADYLREHVGVISEGWNLVNKVKSKTNYVDITYEELSKYVELSENSQTGLVWKDDNVLMGLSKRANTIKKGLQAGWPTSKSHYGGIQINKRTISIHRVLWVMYNKKDLPWYLVINHIDSDIFNNSKENLEAVTFSTNSKKKKKQHNNSTGHVGVAFSKTVQTYVAHIYIDGKRKDKNFSAKKYGEAALDMAIQWRKQMEELHYQDKYVTHELSRKVENE